MVAMLGTSYGVWQVNAAKPSTESVSEEATEKETSTEETDTEDVYKRQVGMILRWRSGKWKQKVLIKENA